MPPAPTDISNSAEEAVRVIAQAAQEASKVIANSAAEAIKVKNTQGINDHDILIELKTRMEGLKSDIKDLTDGTAVKISDHETRINALEAAGIKVNTQLIIGISILTILTSLLMYHIFGMHG